MDLNEDFSFPSLNYMLAPPPPSPPQKKMLADDDFGGDDDVTTSASKPVNPDSPDSLVNARFYTGHILYIYNNVIKVFH